MHHADIAGCQVVVDELWNFRTLREIQNSPATHFIGEQMPRK
jgi:hypothetical protein